MNRWADGSDISTNRETKYCERETNWVWCRNNRNCFGNVKVHHWLWLHRLHHTCVKFNSCHNFTCVCGSTHNHPSTLDTANERRTCTMYIHWVLLTTRFIWCWQWQQHFNYHSVARRIVKLGSNWLTCYTRIETEQTERKNVLRAVALWPWQSKIHFNQIIGMKATKRRDTRHFIEHEAEKKTRQKTNECVMRQRVVGVTIKQLNVFAHWHG